jgi:hypothetical protein
MFENVQFIPPFVVFSARPPAPTAQPYCVLIKSTDSNEELVADIEYQLIPQLVVLSIAPLYPNA